MEKLSIDEAKRRYPNYEDYPNISVTGSLKGMRDKFNWDLSKVVRIGSFYYNLKYHPNMENIDFVNIRSHVRRS